ncbi:uncharacterized protein PHACADRAFT_117403 [Phanerochaete carnosa HHB-10118-sp]|uniref:F-box domain-containing protein n=1 Tax=Phanerochaete carnosa (strain HHB-10118-sp) TaxID=650164 RepID=K5X6G1_PHACS|nr:uncharacterized protein PHACADRAFT_117403 [Phanerochaete carnosa HHB-10118-sp]EKM58442.1 hypothetical protein PHACADRAFT_117403 [Phanerochaete carnosa HHB-10118-sp]
MRQQSIPELDDHIIDFLQDDKSALLACSQVSRGFNARSWHHLFHTLVITDGVHLKRFLLSLRELAFRSHVHRLVLGRQKGRCAPHTQERLQLDTHSILEILSELPNLNVENITVGNICWSVVDLLPAHSTPTASSQSPISNCAYVSFTIHPGTTHVGTGRGKICALPDDVLSADATASVTNPKTPVGIRLVEITAFPLSGGCTWITGAEMSPRSLNVSEIVFHVRDPNLLEPAAHPTLVAVMKSVQAAAVRWLLPANLTTFNADRVAQELLLASAASLDSFTLWTTLNPSGLSLTIQQWAANLALLRLVPPSHIVRIGVGVLFDGKGFCEDALAQVKQVRWRSLLDVLDRFPALHTVEVSVVDKEGAVDDEIWVVLWEVLDSVRARGDGVRLVRGKPRIL